MDKRFIILVVCATLTACSEGGGIGMKESSAWHQTASSEVKRDHFKNECNAFGYEAGSAAMMECIERQWMQSKAAAQKNMQDWSANSTGSNNDYKMERLEREAKRACRSSGRYWSSISKRCR